MSTAKSSAYPNQSLQQAIARVRSIFDADRRNPIDREVAAKHMGYSGLSGPSQKMLGTLSHYKLLEKAGKGQTRVTKTAVDILHPNPTEPEARKKALREAANGPTVFKHIREQFPDDMPSPEALKSWLIREEFLDRAIEPITKAYLETYRYLEQEGATESNGIEPKIESDSSSQEGDDHSDGDITYGGAKVGNLIQWESGGMLQFDKPRRVRQISEDGLWVAVEGSDTGIPMSEVIVQEITPITSNPPPVFPLGESDLNHSDKDNDVRIVQDGNKLQIFASNLDAKGLRALRSKLAKYSEILDMDGQDENQ